jgi:hypothetical protein
MTAQAIDPFRAFTERVARLTIPDADDLSIDGAFDEASALAGLIAEAHKLLHPEAYYAEDEPLSAADSAKVDAAWERHKAAAPAPVADARLFNCCTDCAAPDWTHFAVLIVGGCMDDPEDPGCTLGLIDDAEAQFWTVYGRDEDGISEAITDCPTRADADAVALELAALSGLEILK